MHVSRLYIACFVVLMTFSYPDNGICQKELVAIDQKQGVVIEFPDSVFSFIKRKFVTNDCNNFFVSTELVNSDRSSPCKIKAISEYRNGKLNGRIQYFIFDSVLLAEGYMLDGKPHGLSFEYRVYVESKTNEIISEYAFIMNFIEGQKSGPSMYVDQEYVLPTGDSTKFFIPVIDNLQHWQKNYLHGPEIIYDHMGHIHTYRLYKEGNIVDGKYLHSNLEIVQYKHGEAVNIWNYSFDPPGRLVPSGFKGLNIGYTFFNFNKFKFPIKKMARGQIDYHEFINSQLAK